MPESELLFSPGHLDWERTKRGFELWLKEKPDNLILRFWYTRLAVLADDRTTARAQFEITGGKYFPGNSLSPMGKTRSIPRQKHSLVQSG